MIPSFGTFSFIYLISLTPNADSSVTALPGQRDPEGQKTTFPSRWHLWQTRSFRRQPNLSPMGKCNRIFTLLGRQDSFTFWEDACPPALSRFHPRATAAAERRRVRNDFCPSVNKYVVSSLEPLQIHPSARGILLLGWRDLW